MAMRWRVPWLRDSMGWSSHSSRLKRGTSSSQPSRIPASGMRNRRPVNRRNSAGVSFSYRKGKSGT